MFECPYCEKKLGSSKNLQDHIEAKHVHFSFSSFSDGNLTDAHFKCRNCGKLFENEADLADHLEREDEENQIQIAVSVKRKKTTENDSNSKKTKITDVIEAQFAVNNLGLILIFPTLLQSCVQVVKASMNSRHISLMAQSRLRGESNLSS